MTQWGSRRVPVLVLALLLALTSACGGAGETARKPDALRDKIRVSGEVGSKPTITIAAPLKVETSRSWTLVQGDGDTVGAEATNILQLTLADARTGTTAVSTFDQGQGPLEASMSDQLFPSLVGALTGVRAGSRVVVASTAEDTYGDEGAPQIGIEAGDPVVIVADVLSTDPAKVLDGPVPATSTLGDGVPLPIEEKGEPSGVDVRGLTKPAKLQRFLVSEGTGRAVDGPTRIAADYLGVVWGGAQPFDSSYAQEPRRFSVGISKVVACWDQGLQGVRAGSRVVLVCPPSVAYGATAQPNIPANSTLVFVIDVLGVG